MEQITEAAIIAQLKTVIDPEIHVDVYSLGLIYNIAISEEGIDILMTLTTPFCPYGDQIIQNVEKVLGIFGVEVRVNITFEPEWEPSEELKASLGVN